MPCVCKLVIEQARVVEHGARETLGGGGIFIGWMILATLYIHVRKVTECVSSSEFVSIEPLHCTTSIHRRLDPELWLPLWRPKIAQEQKRELPSFAAQLKCHHPHTYTMPDVPDGGAGGVGGKQLLSAYPAFGSAALMTQDWHVPGSCVTAFALHAALSAPHPLRRFGE